MKPVREHNLGLVLRQVAEHGPRSRATLALETGLNKSTVSSLVAELIEAGLLRDSPAEERPAKVGRPPQSVELDPERAVRARARDQRRLPGGVGDRPGRRGSPPRRS